MNSHALINLVRHGFAITHIDTLFSDLIFAIIETGENINDMSDVKYSIIMPLTLI